ncbi:ADP-ribosyltransferase [Burkholderia ubonensis]|uniref:ADP-ribosyltransferase n=1 Tax=Burkholderia ubonensis TaxID=101571 RepID=UPI0012FB4DDE|nr:ADP-ribosyltransferase [Burkholderia ubonensis]
MEVSKEHELVRYYSAQGYDVINKYLRGLDYNKSQALDTLVSRGYLNDRDTSAGEFNFAMKSYISDLANALKSLPKTDHGVTYRGIALDRNGLDALRESYSRLDGVVVEPAFMSTSPSKPWANDSLIELTLPRGHDGRVLGDLAHFRGEDEMLFPPNTNIKINEIYTRGQSDFNDILNEYPLSSDGMDGRGKIKRIIKGGVLPSERGGDF